MIQCQQAWKVEGECAGGVPGPRTVFSKQVIQQGSEVFRVLPVACGPHLSQQPEEYPARSTASLMAWSLQLLETLFTTLATFHVLPYPAFGVEYQIPVLGVVVFVSVAPCQHS